MPGKLWRPTCGCWPNLVGQGSPRCDRCGKRGVPAGWQYGLIELMGVYARLRGLKPLGDHRPLADKLFKGTTTKCLRCNGSGLLDAKRGKTWIDCPDCRGLRHVYIISREEVEAIRQKVLDAYPNAGAPWTWPPGYSDS